MVTVFRFDGELAPVAFSVPKTSLFGFSFVIEGKKDIEQADRTISRHMAFSLTPSVGFVKFIGRLLKIRVVEEEAVIYAFMVDQVRTAKKARKVD